MYQIGVDIGGTNIKVGLVNETMELVQTCSVRFPHDGARSVVKTIEEAVDFLLRHCRSRQHRPEGRARDRRV
mgnify:CR=1 FL=1